MNDACSVLLVFHEHNESELRGHISIIYKQYIGMVNNL